jgi:hypothetical protein
MLNNFIAPQEACKRKYLATDVRAQSGMLLSISVPRMGPRCNTTRENPLAAWNRHAFHFH